MNTFRALPKLAAALAAFAPLLSYAGTPPTSIPEPGTWALVALAGAVGVLVARNKRK